MLIANSDEISNELYFVFLYSHQGATVAVTTAAVATTTANFATAAYTTATNMTSISNRIKTITYSTKNTSSTSIFHTKLDKYLTFSLAKSV